MLINLAGVASGPIYWGGGGGTKEQVPHCGNGVLQPPCSWNPVILEIFIGILIFVGDAFYENKFT